jgi:hypothetical protein
MRDLILAAIMGCGIGLLIGLAHVAMIATGVLGG